MYQVACTLSKVLLVLILSGHINCVLAPRYIIKSSETWVYWDMPRILVKTGDILQLKVIWIEYLAAFLL